MSSDRYSRWMRRLLTGNLTSGGELWSVPPNYPALTHLRALYEKLGRPREPGSYEVTRSLLLDVIDAGGAVEDSVEKLETSIDEAQAWVTENIPARSPGQPRPTHGEWVSAPVQIRTAYIELAKLLTWVRAVDERMERPSAEERRLQVGLLPCLAEGPLRDEARRLVKTYGDRTSDARVLANYALHAALLPGGGTPRGLLTDDRKLVLRVPDHVSRSIEIFDEFTFEEGREARSYANQLLAAVTEFIDGLLDAFERARPERFRPRVDSNPTV